ncbi:hypothetical protein KFE98_14680 [bacterium SCSIO 12741]|nr:hypothetical protein KFE98_14680 [bacterium SCSIO 12741]
MKISLAILPIFIFCQIPYFLFGQDTISTEYVQKISYEFHLSNGELTGTGAIFLKGEFDASQFVLLGEYHGDARISEFTEAIIPELNKSGFRNFCLETGPVSTQILSELVQSDSVEKTLFDFYTEYYKRVQDIPLPFFEGKEDAAFLQAAIDHKWRLFGIDQEYYSGTLLLLERLHALDSRPDNERAYQSAVEFVIAEQIKDAKSKDYPLHERLLDSKELESYFAQLDQSNAQITITIEQLIQSWAIYSLYDINRCQNLDMRANHMKKEFTRNYQSLSRMDDQPRILIKMGASHTQRGITSNAVYDIGNLVSELADMNGTQDLNIGFMFRYIEDEEEQQGYFDNSEGGSKWLRERAPLMQQGKKDKWVVIDLRKLKEPMINRELWVYPAIKNMIYDLDLIIIPPMDREITLNYKTN